MINAGKEENIANLKNSAQNLRSAVGNVAEDAKEDLRVVANNAGKRVRDFIHTASDEVTHAKDTVTSQIRTNPVQSSMVALGIGFLLGALFRR